MKTIADEATKLQNRLQAEGQRIQPRLQANLKKIQDNAVKAADDLKVKVQAAANEIQKNL